MTTAMVLLWIMGGVTFIIAGYLFGVRRGAASRSELRHLLEQAQYEVEVVGKQADTLSGQVIKDIQTAVGSLLDQERATPGADLEGIESDVKSRGELQRLLDLIASKGHFATVLVSNETGLPVASNSKAHNADEIAGLSSLLLSFADRTVQVRQPALNSILLYDETEQATLHRIFRAGEDRYLLTAVASSAALAPNTLDPALGQIEAVLADRAFH